MWSIIRYTLSTQILLFTSLLLRFYAARYNLDHYNKFFLTQSSGHAPNCLSGRGWTESKRIINSLNLLLVFKVTISSLHIIIN